MARRNQNTFIKRQKEIERVRKAKEKMDRRHGKKKREEGPEGFAPSDEPVRDLDGMPLSDEPSHNPEEEAAVESSPDQ